ncbi:MAG: patatin-like phospholipase family protein [Gammaproteobacteria bacterium]
MTGMATQPGRGKTALILAGGGARAAYQVGIVKAVAELLPRNAPNPFPILCGSSAGAINAAALASSALHFHRGAEHLEAVWRNMVVSQILRTEPLHVLRHGLHWVAALLLGGIGGLNPRSLLDNSPLQALLEGHIPLIRVQQAIDAGMLTALAVTVCSYHSGRSISYFQGVEELAGWSRARRIGRPAEIHYAHLKASTAIPLVFPAEEIDGRYYGDGSMRQTAPISPALHLGADRVLVVGVQHETETPHQPGRMAYPGIGQIAGHVLDTLFMDSLGTDLERLERINLTLKTLGSGDAGGMSVPLRQIDTLVITPSRNLAEMAQDYIGAFPGTVRHLLRGIGVRRKQGEELTSYLLFDGNYCGALIDLGYRDAMAQREALRRFLGIEDETGPAGKAGPVSRSEEVGA